MELLKKAVAFLFLATVFLAIFGSGAYLLMGTVAFAAKPLLQAGVFAYGLESAAALYGQFGVVVAVWWFSRYFTASGLDHIRASWLGERPVGNVPEDGNMRPVWSAPPNRWIEVFCYVVGAGSSLLLAAVLGDTLGTTTIDGDPLRGGGETVQLYDVSKLDKAEYSARLALTFLPSTLLGISSGIATNVQRLKVLAAKRATSEFQIGEEMAFKGKRVLITAIRADGSLELERIEDQRETGLG